MTVVDIPDRSFNVPANPVLDRGPGIGNMRLSVECEVVDRSLNHLGWCNPLAAADIKASTTGTVHRTLNGLVLDAADLANVNPDADQLRVWVVLEDGTRWPVGVFVFDDETTHLGWARPFIDYAMPDQDAILNQGTDFPFGLPPNGSIAAAVHDLLDEFGIDRRNRIIPASPTDVVGNDPPAWRVGTTGHTILDDLCKLAGWLPGFFDNSGFYEILVPPDITSVYPDHVYLPARVHAPSYIAKRKLMSAPNEYVVIGTGPTKSEIIGIASVDPNLPWSIERRRIKIPSVRRVQSVTSTEQVEQMAAADAAAAGGGYNEISFQGPTDPRHDLFHTVQAPDGVVFRETSFVLPLNGGLMSHACALGGYPSAG